MIKKYQIILFHIFFWIFNIAKNRFFAPEFPITYLVIDQLLIASICYFNYFILIPYILKKNKTSYYVYWVILFISTFSLVYATWEYFIYKLLYPNGQVYFLYALRYSFLSSFFYAGISTGSRLALDWLINLDTNRRLLIQKTNAQIQLMKSNINIPFMLQTLDYAEAVAIDTPKNADQPILLLSNVLRYGLYDSQSEEIKLSREIEVLSDFIELNNQMEKDFSFSLEIKGAAEEMNVMPNLLIRFLGAWKSIMANYLMGAQTVYLVIDNATIKMTLPLNTSFEDIGTLLKNQFHDYKNDKFIVTYMKNPSTFTLTFTTLEK